MYELKLHKDAVADLDDLWDRDPDGAADVEVLIQELRDDQGLLAAMRINQREEGRLQFSRLHKYHIWGKNLWRVKVWELEDEQGVFPYRLIYGFVGDVHYVLAVMHRDRGYDKDRQLVERIWRACREVAIPVLPNR